MAIRGRVPFFKPTYASRAHRDILVQMLLERIMTEDVPVEAIGHIIAYYEGRMYPHPDKTQTGVVYNLLVCYNVVDYSRLRTGRPFPEGYLNPNGINFESKSVSLGDNDLLVYSAQVVDAVKRKLLTGTSLLALNNERDWSALLRPALLTITAKQVSCSPETTFYFHTLLTALYWESALTRKNAIADAVNGASSADSRVISMVNTDGFQHFMNRVGKAGGDWTDPRATFDPFKGLLTSLACNIPFITYPL